MADFTATPWVRGSVKNQRGWRDELMVYDGSGVRIANCEAPLTDARHYARAMGEDEANARLIASAPDLLRAAQNMVGSSIRFYEHNGDQKVELANERWAFAALMAAVSDAVGEHDEAQRLRELYPEPVADDGGHDGE